ncbi:gag-pol polyprotein [Tanacetum coccineum]
MWILQQTGIQCFNCKGFGNFAKECKKPKRAKDYAYHKEKIMLCKQEEKGVSLNAQQGDWLDDTDEEPDDQELEAHYMYMSKIQKVLTTNSGPTFDAKPLEKVQIDDEYNVFANEHEHTEQLENMNDIALVEKVDSNTTPNSLDLRNNDFQDDQYADDNDDERVVLANLIANLKLDTDETKKIQKQLRKANATLKN